MSKKHAKTLQLVVDTKPSDDATTEALTWVSDMLALARQDPSGVHTCVSDVTPARASTLLTLNSGNRPMKPVTIQQIRQDILDDAFVMNGEAVIVSDTGELNDGQNRCAAGVSANKAFRTVVVFGTSRASRASVDQGNVRTVRDSAQMLHGDKLNGTHPGEATAVAGMVWQYDRYGTIPASSTGRSSRATVLAEYAARSTEINEALAFVRKNRTQWAKSVVACALILLKRFADAKFAEEFIGLLQTGADLSANSPILIARNRLIERRGVGTNAKRLELIFRAWNFWVNGSEVRTIMILDRIPPLESKRESPG